MNENMQSSASFIRKIYSKIPIKELMALTSKQRDSAYIRLALEFIEKKDKILDLGCGYGRITIPLAARGFNIEGLDISPKLIRIARKRAEESNVNVKFRIGDMRELPYKEETFNKILCFWSTFNHLIDESEQLKALDECFRILKKYGKVIIDVPSGETKWAKERIKKGERIYMENISGVKFPLYIHDTDSLTELAKKSKFSKYEIKERRVGGRKRLLLVLEK